MQVRRGKRSDVDRREEVQAHIGLEADRLVGEGAPRDEAVARARASFGSHPALESGRRKGGPNWLETIGRDLRISTRRLVASRGSTAVILLSLMVGIGVSTSIFSLADQMLIRPLPVHEPNRIVQLRWDGQFVGGGRGSANLLPHSLLLDLQDGQRVFESMAARLLVVIGLYGVLAYAAESRTREVGIRVALGARRSSVARLIVNEAAIMVAAGVALALPAIWVMGRLVRSQLFGIEPTDPDALLLATAILLCVAFAASALPAVRLARTTPLEALRDE